MPGVLAGHLPQKLHGIGDKGDVFQVADGPHRIGAGGAFVHHEGVAVLKQRGQALGDGHLGLHIGVLADGIRGCHPVITRQHSAAVDAHGNAIPLQAFQVPADRLFRHGEFRAQRRHHHLAGGFDALCYDPAPFRSQHLPSPPRNLSSYRILQNTQNVKINPQQPYKYWMFLPVSPQTNTQIPHKSEPRTLSAPTIMPWQS